MTVRREELLKEQKNAADEVESVNSDLIEGNAFHLFLSRHQERIEKLSQLEQEIISLIVRKTRSSLEQKELQAKIQGKEQERDSLLQEISVANNQFEAHAERQSIKRELLKRKMGIVNNLGAQIEEESRKMRQIESEYDEERKAIFDLQKVIESFYVYKWSKTDKSCQMSDTRSGQVVTVDISLCIEKVGVKYDYSNGICQMRTTENFVIHFMRPEIECIRETGTLFEWEIHDNALQCFKYYIHDHNIVDDKVVLTNRLNKSRTFNEQCEQAIPHRFKIKRLYNQEFCAKEVSKNQSEVIKDERSLPENDPHSPLKAKGIVMELSSNDQFTIDNIFPMEYCLIPNEIGMDELENEVLDHPENHYLKKVYNGALKAFAKESLERGEDHLPIHGKALQGAVLSDRIKALMQEFELKFHDKQSIKKRNKYDQQLFDEVICDLKKAKDSIPKEARDSFHQFTKDLKAILQHSLIDGHGHDQEQMLKLARFLEAKDEHAAARTIDQKIEQFLRESGFFLSHNRQLELLRPEFSEQMKGLECLSTGMKNLKCKIMIIKFKDKKLSEIYNEIRPQLRSGVDLENFQREFELMVKIRGRTGAFRHEEFMQDEDRKCWLFVNEIKYHQVDSQNCSVPDPGKSKVKSALRKLGKLL